MVYFNLQETAEYKRGLEYEIKAQNIIKKFEKVDIIVTCHNSDYDFKDSNNITYEVKNDAKSCITNNFFMTYKQKFNNKNEYQPAGISNSKSDFHMLRYGEYFYKIKTTILKMIIFEHKYKDIYFDNNRGDTIVGLKIPVKDLEPYVIKYLIEY